MQAENNAMKAAQASRLSHILAAYALLPNASSASTQLNELTRIIPFFLFFHLSAAISVNVMVLNQTPQLYLGIWQATVLLTSAVLIWAIYQGRKTGFSGPNAESILNVSPLIGLILSFAWITPTLIFSNYANFDQALGLFWITFAILAMGAISLVRLPAAAILFSTLMTIAIAYSAVKTLHIDASLATVIGAFFVMAVVGSIIIQHYTFLRQLETDEKLTRQTQVIKLLLNDFESGSSDWIWETDSEQKLTYFSPRLAMVFGKQISEVLGEKLAELFAFHKQIDVTPSLANLMGDHEIIVDQIYSTQLHEENYYWQISARPLLNEQGEFSGYRGVGRDITNQFKHDFQIKKAKEEAEQANAGKSQFLAIITHELRTPINAIVGFTEILNNEQSEQLSATNRKEYLATILENSQHLQELINDVLDATRIERGTMKLDDQKIDAAELVETAIKICRGQATRANIAIVAHVFEDILITGDLTRLKQVTLNLITNAIKFSPSGGIINIDMRRGKDSELIICIRDAGIGIKPEDAERVFEPFAQGDESATRKFGGMGLGLAIARKIARLHGGDVTLNGEQGIGTEATLSLPLARVRWPNKKAKDSPAVAA